MTSFDKTILIIEDDEGLQSQLKWHFDDFDSTIVTASSLTEAIAAVRLYEPSVVIQDLGLPPDEEGVTEGFKCIREILSIRPSTKIIVLTGKNDHSNALRSIELGAFDFYLKPVDTDMLDKVVAQAFRLAKLEWENNQEIPDAEPIQGVITADTKMKNICRMVLKIASSNITATLLGESGTGKEVLARGIHSNSGQADQEFVAINCAAVPENLMESELFGYEKGAFTGAAKQTIGKIEQADGGTLFLDEIGDMPLQLQAKLLRFLQQRTIERVGGRKEIPVNLRIVCATNKDLDAMVKEGTFREDLYYRICEIEVKIPPLRDRGSDACLIANHLVDKHSQGYAKKSLKLSDDALVAINDYSWPGNIRELENKIKRALVLSDGKMISAFDLDLNINNEAPRADLINLKEARKHAEVSAITSALEISQQNVSAAAKLLGVTRPTLYDMMKKYNFTTDNN
ncbi:PEP-CTERM-box response regulator transcription factor [Reinekea sp.]|jgi:two-component system NtrC family response regulator|uniref:PEP-CTERM-box response regulator transcription factor n=1 Tax=Reinekea sp. TaxID=1970455 RepID=UPI00398A45E7